MADEKIEQNRRKNMAYYGFGPSAMKLLRVCTLCGAPAEAEKNFCIECGQRLPEKTLYDLYLERHDHCDACGSVLTDKMDFCPHCGRQKKTNR